MSKMAIKKESTTHVMISKSFYKGNDPSNVAPAKELHYTIMLARIVSETDPKKLDSRLKFMHSPLSPYETLLEETKPFNQLTRFVNINLIIYRLKNLFLVNCRNSLVNDISVSITV